MVRQFVCFSALIGVLMIAFLYLGWTETEAQQSESLNDLPLLVTDDFEDGHAQGWQSNIPEHWEVDAEEGSLVYRLTTPGLPGEVRAPTSWSILKDFEVTSFVFTGRIKCYTDTTNRHRDMNIIFHYQDPIHFYYVHFSAISDEVHNIIGLVNGKDRVKINHEPPGQSIALLNDQKFHHFKVTYYAETGEIKAYLDDMKTPVLTATDKTLRHGYVGLGSFDDTGSFDDIKLWGRLFKRKNNLARIILCSWEL